MLSCMVLSGWSHIFVEIFCNYPQTEISLDLSSQHNLNSFNMDL
jgi:hypothetical protein